jgi:hypothetical protein
MELEFPKSFKVSDNNLLFYNIINKDRCVIIFCPNNLNNISEITIKYKNYILRQNNTLVSKDGSMTIVFYELSSNESYNDVEVIYRNTAKRYNLCNIRTYYSGELAITTLLNSHSSFMPFYNYYLQQGVKHFYCYYNNTSTLHEIY